MFTLLYGVSYELFYSAGLTNFTVEVSLVTMFPKKTIESIYIYHIENETPVDEGEVGEGRVLMKMECLILFSAPHFLFRSAAADLVRYKQWKTNGILCKPAYKSVCWSYSWRNPVVDR